MKNSFIVLVFCSFLLISCIEKETSISKDKNSEVSSSSSFVQERKEELTELKKELNDTPYSLSRSELDELKADGAISEEDYQELLLLTSNQNSN
ncbi:MULTISPECIES: hypothetical protein [unclassified Halobacteriovorax]|uniref:hypothetical protein n=1 Tax=unclassified Halobacteriovorax TaxID=2639665 RepID=UPI00399A5EE6